MILLSIGTTVAPLSDNMISFVSHCKIVHEKPLRDVDTVEITFVCPRDWKSITRYSISSLAYELPLHSRSCTLPSPPHLIFFFYIPIVHNDV